MVTLKREQEFFHFAELYYNKYGLEPYYDCFALIEEGKKSLDYFWTVLDLITNVTQGHLVGLKKLTPVKIFQFPKSVNKFDAKLRQVCGWRESFADIIQTVSIALEGIGEARTFLSDAKKTIIDWQDILGNIGFDHLFPTENIEQYLTKDITKQELAKQFLSVQNVTEREKYFQGIRDIDSVTQKYVNQIHHIRSSLLSAYRYLAMVFYSHDVTQLELVRKTITVESMADFTRRGDLSGILSEIRKTTDENIKQLNQNITDPLLDIRLKLKMIEANLRAYNDSIEMDSQFYL